MPEAAVMAETAAMIKPAAMIEAAKIAKPTEQADPAKWRETAATPKPARLPPTPRRGRNPARAVIVAIIRTHIVIRWVIVRSVTGRHRRQHVIRCHTLVDRKHSLRRSNGLRGIDRLRHW